VNKNFCLATRDFFSFRCLSVRKKYNKYTFLFMLTHEILAPPTRRFFLLRSKNCRCGRVIYTLSGKKYKHIFSLGTFFSFCCLSVQIKYSNTFQPGDFFLTFCCLSVRIKYSITFMPRECFLKLPIINSHIYYILH